MNSFFDITKMCRICLKNDSAGLVSIFNTVFTIRPAEIVKKLNIFKIDFTDGLPTCLCQSCICRLLDAYNLKQQSELSELRFKEYLSATTPVSYVTKKSSSTEGTPRESSMEKDEEIYEAMNAVCDIFDKNNTDVIEVSDDVLQDVAIDVNNLTNPETKECSQEQIFPKSNNCDLGQNIISKNININKTRNFKNKKKKPDLKVPEKCNECGRVFAYSGYLETHMRMHTGEKPFQCEICNRRFTQIGNLSLHKRIHTGEKRYQCEICSKLFTTSSNLTAHKRCHSEIRNFKCKECYRTFKSQRELNNHSGIHAGTKDHICELCHKAFYKLSYLNVHKKTIHQQVKKYKCDECSKVFSNSSNLICHLRIHTGEKPFKCNICGVRFNQSSALARHSKRHTKMKSNLQTTLNSTDSGLNESHEKMEESNQNKYFSLEPVHISAKALNKKEKDVLEDSAPDFPTDHSTSMQCNYFRLLTES